MINYLSWLAYFEENMKNGKVNGGDFDFLVNFFFDDSGIYETIIEKKYDYREFFYNQKEFILIKKLLIALDTLLDKVGTDQSRGTRVEDFEYYEDKAWKEIINLSISCLLELKKNEKPPNNKTKAR